MKYGRHLKFLVQAFFILIACNCHGQQTWNSSFENVSNFDWLITPVKQKAEVYRSPGGKDIILHNGLVKRSFRISPNVVCIDYKNMSNGQQLLRAVKPEAKLVINDKEYNVGGLKGQKENAYLLPEWLDDL